MNLLDTIQELDYIKWVDNVLNNRKLFYPLFVALEQQKKTFLKSISTLCAHNQQNRQSVCPKMVE